MQTVSVYIACVLYVTTVYSYQLEMTCVSCQDGLYLDQHTKTCASCPTHSRVPDTANATSVLQCECAAGYTPVLGQCTICSVGSFKVDLGNGSCALCATSATTSEPGATAAEACMCSPGFQLSAGACEQCPAGTSKNLISNDLCALCQPGVYCPLGSLTPTACIAHSERTVPGGQALSDCLCVAGYYATPATNGVFSCEACAPGSFKDVSSNVQCMLCAENTYNPDTTAVSADSCRPCSPNSTSSTGSTADTQCLCVAGYSGVPGSQCAACEVGKFRGDMTQYICSECPADSYNAQLHMVSAQSCLPCPANTSTGGAHGSGSIFDCVCNPGFSAGLDFASWRCSECGMGRFQSTPNSSSCDACPRGTYSTATGAVSSTTCQSCANGSYAESVASVECKACLPGTWQDLRAGDAKTKPCTLCPSNSNSSVTGSTEVEQCVCKTGYAISTAHIQGSPDTYLCQECMAGYFCPGGGVFTNCPTNHWSFAGINPGPCRQCAPYSYAARLTDMTGPTLCYCSRGTGGYFDSTCTPCATGTYQPCDFSINMDNIGYDCSESYTAPTCISCPVNTYSDSQQVSACDACPQNASSAEGSKRAQDCVCDNSYYGENGEQCLPCEPGYFCSGSSKTLCRINSNSSALAWSEAGCACDAGFFSNTTAGYCYACTPGFYCPGGDVKIACPTNSSSIRQSSLVASCLCDPGTRRDCVGGASEAGICIVDVYSACHQCAQGDICFESTLLHCPDNSTSPRGSDHGDDCACNAGFFNTVVDDEHAHSI